ncbi:hypothetical protein M427DRAFT_143444 [Gonapodya prolifera JEL478]|uniref:Uncharacterized protein n=1 Tax=Gonapodya prolifera (strain JEL478) TaxID=1344416 RepID=A0A139AR50_GONPJ|nr:hypothetical protein M427DRAFT_143444 [Gonapodya prolifera JEL478]|eukprot:KXS19227.1 hypothetical protein M427DRAFT_143444 [Gonapodya prolifera JEL478]
MGGQPQSGAHCVIVKTVLDSSDRTVSETEGARTFGLLATFMSESVSGSPFFRVIAVLAVVASVVLLASWPADVGCEPQESPFRTPDTVRDPSIMNYKQQILKLSEDCAACTDVGKIGMARAKAYEGSGMAIKRLIAKALRGQELRVGVIGGSTCWPSLVAKSLQSTFPLANITLVNGAVGATGAGYFRFGWMQHIPLSIVGVATFVTELEDLVHSIGRLPMQPAIIYVSTFAPKGPFAQYPRSVDTPLSLAGFYDVPVIDLRSFISWRTGLVRRRNTSRGIVSTQMKQATDSWQILSPAFYTSNNARFTQPRYSMKGEIHFDALSSQISQCDEIPQIQMMRPSPMNPTSPWGPTEMHGWALWDWEGEKFYVVSDTPGSSVTFEIRTSVGHVVIFYFKSRKYSLGDAYCWLDNNETKGIRMSGWWDEVHNIPVGSDPLTAIGPGMHKVNCKLLEESSNPDGGHHFWIYAVAAS